MKTPNFTPGPWSADKWAPGYTVSAPESHYSICHLQDCNNEEANARLIAAAPAIYDALMLALPYVETALEDKGYKPGVVNRMTKTIRDALALVDSPDATTGAEIASKL